jgi:hypothetical protein
MKKQYGFWLGSFLIIAASLYVYFHVPLFPILIGGFVSLTATLLYNRLKKK